MNRKGEAFFEQMYVLYADDLFNYGRHMGLCRGDVEDIIHDMFLHLMLKNTDPGTIDNPKAFLFQCFHNRMLDLLRSRKAHPVQCDVYGAEEVIEDSDRFTIAKRVEEGINKAISSLSQCQRTALILRYLQSFGYDDISTIIGCTPHAARKFVSKALASIRRQSDKIEELLNDEG